MEGWWKCALDSSSQLRFRVGFALSQIFVVSFNHPSLKNNIEGVADYYDMLSLEGDGNYRELLESVTLSPIMDAYLNMLRNVKESPTNGTFPDENFAREIMQLFSSGLVKLNLDGSAQLDQSGEEIPTYDNEAIQGFAVDSNHIG